MARNDQLRDKVVTYLQDAAAMEKQIEEILEKQVDDTKPWPQIQARISEHLDETKIHRQRMEECLKSYNEKPSGVKSAVATMMGNLAGATAGARSDALAKEARDDYTTEHLEIASYLLLIATAQAYGDTTTVQACEANLRDEVRMAHWLEQHMAQTALLSYEKDSIQIPQADRLAAESVAEQALLQARDAAGIFSQQSGTGMGTTQPRGTL